jgi:hypothetical protein
MSRITGGPAHPRRNPKKPKVKHLRGVFRPTDSNQSALIDDTGAVPFNPDTDADAIAELPGGFKLCGMVGQLLPPPRDRRRALTMTVAALQSLHRARPAACYSEPSGLSPLSIEVRECSLCDVTFRTEIDDGVIRATYSRPDDKLSLSLPHPDLWPTSGLAWLGQHNDCCARNRKNPTPWRERSCGCTDAKTRPVA